jgi:hypothetical protein
MQEETFTEKLKETVAVSLRLQSENNRLFAALNDKELLLQGKTQEIELLNKELKILGDKLEAVHILLDETREENSILKQRQLMTKQTLKTQPIGQAIHNMSEQAMAQSTPSPDTHMPPKTVIGLPMTSQLSKTRNLSLSSAASSLVPADYPFRKSTVEEWLRISVVPVNPSFKNDALFRVLISSKSFSGVIFECETFLVEFDGDILSNTSEFTLSFERKSKEIELTDLKFQPEERRYQEISLFLEREEEYLGPNHMKLHGKLTVNKPFEGFPLIKVGDSIDQPIYLPLPFLKFTRPLVNADILQAWNELESVEYQVRVGSCKVIKSEDIAVAFGLAKHSGLDASGNGAVFAGFSEGTSKVTVIRIELGTDVRIEKQGLITVRSEHGIFASKCVANNIAAILSK